MLVHRDRVLQTLRAEQRLHHVRAPCDRAVMLQKRAVILPAELRGGLGQLRRAGDGIGRAGDHAELHRRLERNGQIKGLAQRGIGRRGRGMGMNDAAQRRIFAVDRKMHGDLARDAPRALDDHALRRQAHKHFRRHEALRDAGRRRPDRAVGHAGGDVAVVGGDIAALIEAASGLQNGLPGLVGILIAHVSIASGKSLRKPSSNGGRTMPRSVTMPLSRLWSVTSKLGL